MFRNAVREARTDALENACKFLRTILKDMGYANVDSVEYEVVQLTEEAKADHNKYMARVKTSLSEEPHYGEPQLTQKEAKQSAAYAAILYMCRAKQFGRNFVPKEEEEEEEKIEERRPLTERKRASTTNIKQVKEEELPRVELSLDTFHRNELDDLLDKYTVEEKKKTNKLERSMSLTSVTEINWAAKKKKQPHGPSKLYF